MQDTIKVFTDVPNVLGYIEVASDPFAVQFRIDVQLHFYGVKDNVVFSYQQGYTYSLEVGDAAGTVYAAFYTEILAICEQQGFPIPTQKDIFCYVPISLSQIFADIPALA